MPRIVFCNEDEIGANFFSASSMWIGLAPGRCTPIGAENQFKGVIDLVRGQRGLGSRDARRGAVHNIEKPAELADQAKEYREAGRGRGELDDDARC